jgi:hypothetical protein
MHTQKKSRNCASGIGGVKGKKGVGVGVIGQQVQEVVALTPNGNIDEGMQANVEVGETFATLDVCTIEIDLQRTIDMIKDQEIVVPRQESANGNVDPHAQIDEGEILYLTYYNQLGFFLSNL